MTLLLQLLGAVVKSDITECAQKAVDAALEQAGGSSSEAVKILINLSKKDAKLRAALEDPYGLSQQGQNNDNTPD